MSKKSIRPFGKNMKTFCINLSVQTADTWCVYSLQLSLNKLFFLSFFSPKTDALPIYQEWLFLFQMIFL